MLPMNGGQKSLCNSISEILIHTLQSHSYLSWSQHTNIIPSSQHPINIQKGYGIFIQTTEDVQTCMKLSHLTCEEKHEAN